VNDASGSRALYSATALATAGDGATAAGRGVSGRVVSVRVGTAHAALRQNDEAKAAFGQVLKLNPRAAAAQTALAGLNLASGSTDAAVQFARDALVNAPGNATAQLLLVRGLLAKGDVNRAQSELAALTSRAPDDPNVRAVNGTLLLLKKDQAGAQRDFEKALQKDPKQRIPDMATMRLALIQLGVDPARIVLELDYWALFPRITDGSRLSSRA